MSDFLTFKKVKIISHAGDVLVTTLGDYLLQVRTDWRKGYLFFENKNYQYLLVTTPRKNLPVLNKFIEKIDDLLSAGSALIDVREIANHMIDIEDC